MKIAALGRKYELSFVISSVEEICKLNLIYRNIDRATDILSFPLSKDSGEIHLCLSEARRESKNFKREYENFIAFLFIHGCAHLKGHDHSARMEEFERTIREKFRI